MADLFAGGSQWLLDSDLLYYPDYLSSTAADSLQQYLLTAIPWQSETVVIYGKEHVVPRLQAWLGEGAVSYRYSGKTFTTRQWPQRLADLAAELSTLAGVPFNSVLLNLYRDGQDAMGWHADDEPELGDAPVIASLSLGAERDFALRRKGEPRQHCTIALAHGSLLIMQPGMQSRWQHAVPRRAGIQKPRINMTFRRIIN